MRQQRKHNWPLLRWWTATPSAWLTNQSSRKWFFTESTAEVLAAKAPDSKCGKQAAAFIAKQPRLRRKATITLLPAITNLAGIDDTDRYHYGRYYCWCWHWKSTLARQK